MHIKQYPHYLHIVESAESEQSVLGDWASETTSKNTLLCRCREETNGKGEEVRTASGSYFRFSSLIQLPLSAPPIQEGTEVIISNDPEGIEVRIKGIVGKYSHDQLHCRVWI